MTRGFWATTCQTHGTFSARNESMRWVKAAPSKHPKQRTGKSGCPFCKRDDNKAKEQTK